MEDALFNLLLTALTTVITVVGAFLTNFINEKVGEQKAKNYAEMAKQIVMSVEQYSSDLDGTAKKESATAALVEFTNNKLTETQANTLIEAAVYEIKQLTK
ncbi:MAG: phage holin [Peptostreptococcaceae bacterium]